MEASGQSERNELRQSFTIPRGFLIFMIVVSGWFLYSRLRHMPLRFEVPRHLITSFDAFGRIGSVLDWCFYLLFAWFLVSIVRWGRNGVERIGLACWIAPIMINPLKILIPRYSYMVWWTELFLAQVFFLATIALYLNWKPSQTLARCRARFSALPKPPRTPEL